jgi:hypothetical protein
MADTEARKEKMSSAVTRYMQNSKVNAKGEREIPRDVYAEGLETHGVTIEEIKRVNAAVAFENTAAAGTLTQDILNQISEASPEDLKSEDFRRGMTATVKIPTVGGRTVLTMNGEAQIRIPGKPDVDGNNEPKFKTAHGRLGMKVDTKGHIDKSFHEEAEAQIRKALGLDK